MPKYEKIFQINKPALDTKQQKSFDKKLRKYFTRLFRTLIIHFDVNDIRGGKSGEDAGLIEIELKNFVSELTNRDLNKEDYTFNGKCAFCQMCDFNYYHRISLEEKLNNGYSNCVMLLGIRYQHGESQENSLKKK